MPTVPNTIAGTSGAAAAITISALNATSALNTNARLAISRIDCSYSAAPTNGGIKIESPSGTIIWQMDITAAGPCPFPFDSDPIYGAAGAAMIVTLLAPGGSVVGKLNVVQRDS